MNPRPGALVQAQLLTPANDGSTNEITARETGVPGLLATNDNDSPGWCVFHRRSGAVVRMMDDPEQAIAFAHAIRDFTDWTATGDAVVSIAGLHDYLDRTAERMGLPAQCGNAARVMTDLG